MTDITDAETAEVQWASGEQGRAAHKAAWSKLREMGLHQHVDATQLGQIIYAAYLAAGWDGEPGEADEADEPGSVGCEHRWVILKAQAITPPGVIFGKPVPHTAVLARCQDCGLPESWLLIGEWTRDELSGWTDKHLAGRWEPVP